MKKLFIFPVLIALFCFLSFGSLDVSAADGTGYNYTTTYERYSDKTLWKYVRHDTVSSGVRIAYLHRVETYPNGSTADVLNLYSVSNGSVFIVPDNGSGIPNVVSVFDLYENGDAKYEGADIHSATINYISFVVHEGEQLRTDVPCFDEKSYLDSYLLTGDDSGQTNKGVSSEKHDFSNDLVDTNIPLAEISNISHNGFLLNNREDYNVDLYVESYLYGVKHSSFFPKVSFSVDTSWIYASHSYNFDSFTITSDSINMNSYNVDNEGNLASDFKLWSSIYPKPSLLPDYAWYKTSTGSSSFDLHVYDSSLSDSANLARSEQGCTVYYVRYYHVVDGRKIGGQWMQYTFRDGDGKGTMDDGVLISSGTVIGGGKVNVDSNGDIYITDSVTGSQDLQGNITYISDSNDLYVDSAFSVIQDMANAIGKVPHLLETLFPFLPWWCVASLGAAIVICIILRIAGR